MPVEMLRHKWQKFFADTETSRYLIHRLLSENFSKYAKRYVFALILMVVVAVTTALTAWIMKDIVNEIFVSKDFNKVWLITVAVMGIFTVRGLATYYQSVVMARIGNAIVADHQRKLYRHFMTQGADFFKTYPASELITRISHNAIAARTVLDLLITNLGRDLFSVIGLVTVMILQDPLLSMIAFVIAPPVIFLVTKLVKRVKRVAKSQFVSMTYTTQVTQESAKGFRIIRTFGLQNILQGRMDEAITGVEQKTNKIAGLSARTIPMMDTLGGFVIALIVLYSGWRTIVGGQSPGEFISFLTALLLAYDPARRISICKSVLKAVLSVFG